MEHKGGARRWKRHKELCQWKKAVECLVGEGKKSMGGQFRALMSIRDEASATGLSFP